MNAADGSKEDSSVACKAGKFLTFLLGKESYGVGILRVREIIRLPEITPVPFMPSYLCGVINLRGKIVPVADLCARFGLSTNAQHSSIARRRISEAAG